MSLPPPLKIWRAETGALAAALPGGRLHLQHGPIDLLITAKSEKEAQTAAYNAAWTRFQTILDELVAELPALRRPAKPWNRFEGLVARRMVKAVEPHCSRSFITPMAAVAGSVADEVLTEMVAKAPVDLAIVNNGGDIAVHLSPGQTTSAAIADHEGKALGRIELSAEAPVRGIATSGRHGRSLSLGVADSVTVLAKSAAAADAAATMIANAVMLPGHPEIHRAPARACDPDSDLGARPVVVGVGRLTQSEINEALSAGRRVAEDMRDEGLIVGASLHLMGAGMIVGEGMKATALQPA